mmetsp:Transcript_10440/g.36648  ORF Transcript_10440/g.36648 Transcript_10440/m.36648 type:complete len:484 (+) Transcript_10440:1073-2524(+)
MKQPNPVRRGKRAPERVDLAVRLRFVRVQRRGPIQLLECGEALVVGLVEERCAVSENEPSGHALGVAEELVPVVVICNIGGQEAVQALAKLLHVTPILGIDADAVIPLVEDRIVYRPDDLGQEETAVVGAGTLVARNGCCAIHVPRRATIRCEDQLRDKVQDLGHETDVARLAPDEQEHRDIPKLLPQLRALGLDDSCLGVGNRWRDIGLLFFDMCGLALVQFLPPSTATLKQLGVQVAQGFNEEILFVDLLATLHSSVGDGGAMRTPKGQQVLELVADVVRLEIEHDLQGSEDIRRQVRKVLCSGQDSQTIRLQPSLLQFVVQVAGLGLAQVLLLGNHRLLLEWLPLCLGRPHETRRHRHAQEHDDGEQKESTDCQCRQGPLHGQAVGRANQVATLGTTHDALAPSVDGEPRRVEDIPGCVGLAAEKACHPRFLVPCRNHGALHNTALLLKVLNGVVDLLTVAALQNLELLVGVGFRHCAMK